MNEMAASPQDELAGIEYYGIAGGSSDCQNAVMRLLQFGDRIDRVRIISCSNEHCLLLTKDVGDLVAIKSGFASGYGGEGPRRFSYVLQFLAAHGAEIDECEVDSTILERLDNSALTVTDLERIDTAKLVRPSRWYDYVMENDYRRARDGTLWQEFPPVVPYAIVDPRVMGLALSFWVDPDARLVSGYRRLEDIVRERTSLNEHGTKLFSKAFAGSPARLEWDNLDDGEKAGRLNLFTGAYMAHRNPRTHRELKKESTEQLAEFLLLNHLYRLEKESHTC